MPPFEVTLAGKTGMSGPCLYVRGYLRQVSLATVRFRGVA